MEKKKKMEEFVQKYRSNSQVLKLSNLDITGTFKKIVNCKRDVDKNIVKVMLLGDDKKHLIIDKKFRKTIDSTTMYYENGSNYFFILKS